MALRVERRDGTGERTVLIGMIVSKSVLGPIAAKWEPGLFPSRAGNLIGSWCVDYYGRYHKAPNRNITSYFDHWATTSDRDPETVALIESLLGSLSDESERMRQELSPEYVVDLASKLFNKHKLGQLQQQIESTLKNGEVDKAEQLVSQFRHVEIGTGAGINVLTADAEFESAFEQRADVLVQYPGDLGTFFGKTFARDTFVAFLAKEKGGKSRWIFDVAWRALEQKRNVAYFEMGDLSKAQILTQRIATRLTRRPLEACRYLYPIELNMQGVDGVPKHDYLRTYEPLAIEQERTARHAMARMIGPDRFKLSCHPAGVLSVPAAEEILNGWARDDWVPDLIAFDYLDLAAPVDRRADKLEQINDTWIRTRALSQQRHCCVVTATQCNREGFSSRILRREHVGGDHRKLAHVTAMFGVNQSGDEHELGVYRINPVVGRELDWAETRCCYTAACLAINDPAVLSLFPNREASPDALDERDRRSGGLES